MATKSSIWAINHTEWEFYYRLHKKKYATSQTFTVNSMIFRTNLLKTYNWHLTLPFLKIILKVFFNSVKNKEWTDVFHQKRWWCCNIVKSNWGSLQVIVTKRYTVGTATQEFTWQNKIQENSNMKGLTVYVYLKIQI